MNGSGGCFVLLGIVAIIAIIVVCLIVDPALTAGATAPHMAGPSTEAWQKVCEITGLMCRGGK